MRKIATVFSALALTVGLAACASDTTEQVVSQPTTTSGVDTDEVYLGVVRNEYPVLEVVEDETLIGLSGAACETFDSGASASEVIFAVMSSFEDAYMQEAVVYAIGAGVGAYCPEHASKFDMSRS